MKKLFWAANTYWNSPFQVGAQHLAKQFLADGWQVVFVSDPISPLHFLQSSTAFSAKDRFKSWYAGGHRDFSDNLIYYSPLTLLTPHNKPVLRSQWVLDHWHRLTVPSIKRFLQKNDFQGVDLLITDTVTGHIWKRLIDAKKHVFRVTDNSMGFTKMTPQMQKKERDCINAADLVTCTSKAIASQLQAMGAKSTLYLPNGVDLDQYSRPAGILPQEYQSIKRPIAVYVGAIDEWFDYELINYASEIRQDISFVLIGPDAMAQTKIVKRHNVFILGAKPNATVPNYLYHADMGLIPFDVKNHKTLVDYISPLKLYEYMASGLPVLSVKWQELVGLNSPAVLYASQHEFFAGLDKIIADDFSWTRENKLHFVEYAQKNSWQSRYQLLSAELARL